MRFFLADMRRSLTEIGFFLALVAGGCCTLISLAISWGAGDGYTLFTSAHSLALPLFAPLLCALPYSNMQMIEEASGFDQLMALHLGHKNWLYPRFLANGLVSGMVALFPGLLLLLLSITHGTQAFTLEIFQILGLNFFFGLAFGSLSYGLCFLNTQAYIPLVAPQVLYLFALYALPILDLNQYFPALAIAPWILPSLYQLGNMLALLSAITALGLLFVTLGQVRRAVTR